MFDPFGGFAKNGFIERSNERIEFLLDWSRVGSKQHGTDFDDFHSLRKGASLISISEKSFCNEKTYAKNIIRFDIIETRINNGYGFSHSKSIHV